MLHDYMLWGYPSCTILYLVGLSVWHGWHGAPPGHMQGEGSLRRVLRDEHSHNVMHAARRLLALIVLCRLPIWTILEVDIC